MRDVRIPLHIVVDTREQQPFAWEACDAVVEFAGLSACDYALLEDVEIVKGRELRAVRFGLERKSLPDLVGTLASGWERFNAELTRMEAMSALYWSRRISSNAAFTCAIIQINLEE